MPNKHAHVINPELDKHLLKLLMTKAAYAENMDLIDLDVLAKESQQLIKAYGEYYKESEKSSIELADFMPWFLGKNQNLLSEDVLFYKTFLSRVAEFELQDTSSSIKKLKQEKMWWELEKLKQTDFDAESVSKVIGDYVAYEARTTNAPIFTHSYIEASEMLKSKGNINWPIQEMNAMTGPLGLGTFCVVMAGHNCGKTAFLISTVINALEQLPEEFDILYFNNEEHNARILKRMYACLIKKPNSVLDEHPELAVKRYMDRTKGRIKIVNCDGKGLNFVEMVCRQTNPGLIIIDQVDKLMVGKEADKARAYDYLYNRCRILAKTYAPIIGTTQASNGGRYFTDSGECKYKEWLDINDMFWSRVDKQANNELVLGIGVPNNFPTQRNISVVRCKETGVTDGKVTCKFDPMTSRYY